MSPRLPATPQEPRLHPGKRAALVRRIAVGWQDRALCTRFPPDDWFPTPTDSDAVAEVIEVCTRCPVRTSCLAAALATGEEHGIWGGTTETDRAEALRVLNRRGSVPRVLDQLLTRDHTEPNLSAAQTQQEGDAAA